MKKHVIYFILSFLLFSCEEVVEIDLEDGETRLVIDAYFEVYNDNNTLSTSDENGIQLTLSAPYFDNEILNVSDAIVFITNLNDDSVTNFMLSSFNSGLFVPENGTTFIPEFGIEYQLNVLYDDETYIATAELIPTVPIDSLTEGDGVLFDGDETEVIVEFTDEIIRDDYYILDVGFDLYVLTRDEFYQGQTFNFSYFYESEELNTDIIAIKIMGVDEDYFNYFDLVLSQSQQGGNPFQTPPALIKGNVINTTNTDNFAYGYFRMSEADIETLTLED